MRTRALAGILVRSLQGAKRALLPGLDVARVPVVRRWADRLESAARRRDVVEILGHTLHLDDQDSLGLSGGALFEPAETQLFQRLVRPGQCVVDVGANIGYFTLLFARAVGPSGRVIALEPEPGNLALLRRNVEVNGYRNVTIVPKAAWHEPDTLTLHVSGKNRGDHRLFAADERRSTIRVDAGPLDRLAEIPQVVHVVKMDIQGAEMRALEGMRGVLERNRDVVLVTELWPDGLRRAGTDPRAFVQALRTLGFGLHVLAEDGSLAAADVERLRASLDGEQYANLVCSRGTLP